MIASPSDLAEERDAVERAINDWNADHATAEAIALIPVRWERHSTPTAGVRPQQALNEQIVSQCDLVIGLFGTRIGTSSGVADSGTVEEIDQFVEAQKPAMMYFSRRPVDVSTIDLNQQQLLRDFKAATYKTALVGEFTSVGELYHQITRDLIKQVRTLSGRRVHINRRIEEAKAMTELLIRQRDASISREDFEVFRASVMGDR